MGKDLEMADLEKQQKKEAAEAKKKERELLKQQKQAEKEARKQAKAEAKALKQAEKEAGKVDPEKADDKASKVDKKVKEKKVKEKSGEPREKFKNTIPMHRRIATKLVGAFMIPVACIVVLGVVSYNKAATAIEDNYRETAAQTVVMMDRYITTAIESVQAVFRDNLENDEFKGLFGGNFATDPIKESSLRREWNTILLRMATSDKIYSNVYVLCDNGDVAITSTLKSQDGMYSAYKATEQGEPVSKDKYTHFWYGNDAEIDATLGTPENRYAIRYAKQLTNKSVIVTDIEYSYIMDILNTLDVGEGSYVGLVTNMDNQEILSDLYTLPEEPVFVGSDFYLEAMASEEESGSM